MPIEDRSQEYFGIKTSASCSIAPLIFASLIEITCTSGLHQFADRKSIGPSRDIADAGTGQFQGTTPGGINAKGETEGSYLDDNNVYHGYLRTREGQITIVNIPGAGDSPTQNYPHEGTIVANINEGGDVTGAYFDANLVSHAFIRYRDGRIETFDAPDAGTAVGQGTYPQCNNARNAITGYYFDANGVLRGFVRTPSGE